MLMNKAYLSFEPFFKMHTFSCLSIVRLSDEGGLFIVLNCDSYNIHNNNNIIFIHCILHWKKFDNDKIDEKIFFIVGFFLMLVFQKQNHQNNLKKI